MTLLLDVENHLQLASYQPGRIEFEPAPNAPTDLAQRLGACLQAWSGSRWAVSVVNSGGAPTLRSQKRSYRKYVEAKETETPLVQAALSVFPKAKITDVKSAADLAHEIEANALSEVDEEWDPFETE